MFNTPFENPSYNPDVLNTPIIHVSQVTSTEHFAPQKGSELPDLTRHYGHSLDISRLTPLEPFHPEKLALANLHISVTDSVDQLTAIVSTEFQELKRSNQTLKKSACEEKNLLKKQNKNLIEIVPQC